MSSNSSFSQSKTVAKNLILKDSSGKSKMVPVIEKEAGVFVADKGCCFRIVQAPVSKMDLTRGEQLCQTNSLFPVVNQSFDDESGQGFSASIDSTIPRESTDQYIETDVLGETLSTSKSYNTDPSTINVDCFGGTERRLSGLRTKRNACTNEESQEQFHAKKRIVMSPIKKSHSESELTQMEYFSGNQLDTEPSISCPQSMSSCVDLSSQISSNYNPPKSDFFESVIHFDGNSSRDDTYSEIKWKPEAVRQREMSKLMYDKISSKGSTCYNELASELIEELALRFPGQTRFQRLLEEKNIRRRVYDVLNVFTAMKIITRDSKSVTWIGPPTVVPKQNFKDCKTLEAEREQISERLIKKKKKLHELISKLVSYKSLVERNKEAEKKFGPQLARNSLTLPFITVKTNAGTKIDCLMSDTKSECLLNFEETFEIQEDLDVLKAMGFSFDQATCSFGDFQKAREMLPLEVREYIDRDGTEEFDWKNNDDTVDSAEVDKVCKLAGKLRVFDSNEYNFNGEDNLSRMYSETRL